MARLALVAALWAEGAGAAERAYAVVGPESRVSIHVGRAGLFKFAGHEHEVLAPAVAGRIVAEPEALERSSVSLDFESAALEVSGRGEPPEDVPKVQEAMLGPKVLDAVQFPAIRFRSTRVSGKALAAGGPYELQVQGELTVRGVARPFALPLRVELDGERLVARGQASLRQSSFGIKPISVAGVVKVKDELAIDFEIVARAEQPASGAQEVP
jgi:polyisoprenoid-binding protein YceI